MENLILNESENKLYNYTIENYMNQVKRAFKMDMAQIVYVRSAVVKAKNQLGIKFSRESWLRVARKLYNDYK